MTLSAKRVAARFAAMDAAKLEAVMLKIRKGADSSLTWSQLGEVLGALEPPWKLEKMVGLVKLYGYRGNEDNPEHFWNDDRNEVEKHHQALQKDEVKNLPANPKHGQLYVVKLSEVQPARAFKDAFEFEFEPWMGHEGWRITTPSGKSLDVLPDRYGLGNLVHGYRVLTRGKISLGSVALRWLKKETDFLDQINKKMGLGEYESSIPRTRDSTGSCPVCFQNIKIKGGAMVLHGYKRPGTGETHGSCWGVGFPAFELKVEGTKDYLDKSVEPEYEKAKRVNQAFEQDKIEELLVPRAGGAHAYLTITRDDPEWKYRFGIAKEKAKRDLEYAKSDLEVFQRLIKNWKARPLPKEGDRHIDWYTKGQQG